VRSSGADQCLIGTLPGGDIAISPVAAAEPGWSNSHTATAKKRVNFCRCLDDPLHSVWDSKTMLNRASFLHVLNHERDRVAEPIGLKCPTRLIPNGITTRGRWVLERFTWRNVAEMLLGVPIAIRGTNDAMHRTPHTSHGLFCQLGGDRVIEHRLVFTNKLSCHLPLLAP